MENKIFNRGLKVLHLLAVSLITGLSIAITAILISQTGSSSVNRDMVIVILFNKGIAPGFYLVMVTSALYSMFTHWGFVKYRWIISKWILLWSLFALTWFWGGPSLNGMAALSDGGLDTVFRQNIYRSKELNSLIYLLFLDSALFILFLLSVFKPFGKRAYKEKPIKKTAAYIVGGVFIISAFLGFAADNQHSGFRNSNVETLDIKSLPDGIYKGEKEYGSWNYKVHVTVRGGRITAIEAIDNRDSPYAFYAEGVFFKIMKEQRLDVDAISGATTTSIAFQEAVLNALKH